MPITIGSNIASLKAERQLGIATDSLSNIFGKLSSGQRITKASDDAAGLAIASGLNVDGRVFTQGIRNLNDGTSFLNVAAGALNALSTITVRQQELAEQAANGTYSYNQRTSMDNELQALENEYTRIVQSTSFNGITVVDSPKALQVQAGYGVTGSLALTVGDQLARTVGNGTFQAATSFTGGAFPEFSITGDFNGDGNSDIIISEQSAVSIFFGNGNGTFQAKVTIAAPITAAHSLSALDVNGDGILDLVSSDLGAAAVFIGNGNGTFKAEHDYTTGSDGYSLAAGDFNNDGNTDLVTAGGSISLLLNNGNGTFLAARTASGGSTFGGATVGDFNSDGNLDIATVDNTSNMAQILFGVGNGTFQSARTYAVGAGPRSLTAVDVNNDGILDLAVANSNSSTVSILIGNYDGTFKAQATYGTGTLPDTLSISDFNGDGFADLVTADNVSGTTSVLIGNGDGTFRARTSFSTNSSVYSVAVGDFNNDKIKDLVTTQVTAGGAINILLGNSNRTTIEANFNIRTQSNARAALSSLSDRATRISSELGAIGAFTSRLSVASNVLSSTRENYASAESGILDVDVAEESANLVRTQILQQAAAAVLAQANNQPQLALQILHG